MGARDTRHRAARGCRGQSLALTALPHGADSVNEVNRRRGAHRIRAQARIAADCGGRQTRVTVSHGSACSPGRRLYAPVSWPKQSASNIDAAPKGYADVLIGS